MSSNKLMFNVASTLSARRSIVDLMPVAGVLGASIHSDEDWSVT